MRLQIVGVGRLKDGPERSLTDDYVSRTLPLARQLGFRGFDEHEVASGGGLEAEGARLLARIPDGANCLRLDEAGENLTSTELARRLAAWRDDGLRDTVFLIGGAEGFSADVRRAVPRTLAFGAQTWPHRLVRAMLAEQVYRAMTILAGTPYHKACPDRKKEGLQYLEEGGKTWSPVKRGSLCRPHLALSTHRRAFGSRRRT
jgi:23S rRNA (pseudouridine1915-N3)-methyltransferase